MSEAQEIRELINYLERRTASAEEVQAAVLIEKLQAENAAAHREATTLAMALWKRHYRAESPNFGLCDSVAGIISQIDNMTAGMSNDLATLRQRVAELEKDAARLNFLIREELQVYEINGHYEVREVTESSPITSPRQQARTAIDALLAAAEQAPNSPAERSDEYEI